MTEAIYVQGLTKTYTVGKGRPPLRAVDGIGFTVREGEVFGFLGPNGAGKTTTIRMLTGLSRPTAGTARLLGLDLAKDLPRIKKRIGVVPEVSNLYDELSALDNLVFAMQLYGVPRRERKARAESLLERFRLGEKCDTSFARLSRGMKRALTIAAALAHRPPLVFLDEPTTGLGVNGVLLTLLLSATAFSALGAYVSVAVREVFEAQTLANFMRFPMMFLGGVFVPLASMPAWLQVLARFLPLTYVVEALQAVLDRRTSPTTALDLGALVAFTVVLFWLAVRTLARRVA